MDDTSQTQEVPDLEPLTTELICELWSLTYNTRGKPDWSHLFPYYHDDIIFEDSIQCLEGKAEFMAKCNRLAQRDFLTEYAVDFLAKIFNKGPGVTARLPGF